VLPLWRIHRHIGMGGDQLVKALTNDQVERTLGEQIRSRQSALFEETIGEVEPIRGATELLAELRAHGYTVVLASSAKRDEVERYVDLLGARQLADRWTSASDVEATKPQPDLVNVALDLSGGDPERSLMIGDSTWDVRAAARAGVPTVALLAGGFSDSELRDSGAAEVYRSVEELREAVRDGHFEARHFAGVSRGDSHRPDLR